jgi:hypothetical protein
MATVPAGPIPTLNTGKSLAKGEIQEHILWNFVSAEKFFGQIYFLYLLVNEI